MLDEKVSYRVPVIRPGRRIRPTISRARVVHELRSEGPQMPVMARKTSEKTAGVFENTLRIGEGV
jgi:hypothetical protein